MKLLCKIILCLGIFTPLSVKAADCCFDDCYISVWGGGNWSFDHDVCLDNGWFAGGAIGTHIDCDWRADVSYDYVQSKVKHDSSECEKVHAALFNIYTDLCSFDCVTPFFGAGIGYAYVDNLCSGNRNQFAFQGGVGLRYDIDHCWSVSATYRILGHLRDNNHGYHHLLGAVLTRNF